MSIELPLELEQLVRSKVASGRYQTVSDVLHDALGLLEEREIYTALHKDDIRGKIAAAYDSLRAGRGVDGEAVFARIDGELAAMEQPAA